MTTKKGKLIDLFKTPSKIKKPQYSTLDNSLKVVLDCLQKAQAVSRRDRIGDILA